MKTKTLEYLTAVIATIVLMLRRFFFGWIGVDTKIDHVLANQESMRNELDEIFERFVELESQHRLLMEKNSRAFAIHHMVAKSHGSIKFSPSRITTTSRGVHT